MLVVFVLANEFIQLYTLHGDIMMAIAGMCSSYAFYDVIFWAKY